MKNHWKVAFRMGKGKSFPPWESVFKPFDQMKEHIFIIDTQYQIQPLIFYNPSSHLSLSFIFTNC